MPTSTSQSSPFFIEYLRFAISRMLLQFTSLPFGLCTFPRNFTKVLIAIPAPLRVQGLRVHHYLDDILFLARDQVELLSHRVTLIHTLQKFGWIINSKKSQPNPTQRLMYLGALFNTAKASFSIPVEKVVTVRRRILAATVTHLSAS